VVVLACIVVLLVYTLWRNRYNRRLQAELFAEVERKELERAEMDGELSKHVLLALADTRYKGVGDVVPADFSKAETMYAKVAETSPEGYLKLGRMHRDGGAEQPPDGLKAVENYLLAYELGGYEDAVLELGDIYAFGLHPFFLPEKTTAGKIFTYVTFQPNFSQRAKDYAAYMLKDISKLSYNDLDLLKIHEVGRTYTQLPVNIVDTLLATQPLALVTTEKAARTPTPAPRQRPPERQADVVRADVITTLFEADPAPPNPTEWLRSMQTQNERRRRERAQAEHDRLPPEIQRAINRAAAATVRSDAQNVHDGEMQNAAAANLRAIEQEQGSGGGVKADLVEQVKASLQSNPRLTSTDKTHIARVLATIDNSNVHSKYGRTEKQVLDSVWSRINSDVNKDNKDELVLALGQQLASGVEHGFVVCSTGKIMRMMGTLEALDAGQDLVQMKPKWAIEREIGEAAGLAREEVLQESEEKDRQQYETGDHPDLTKRMRDKLWDKCVKDYVEPGILNSDEALRLIVMPYLDSF